MKIAVDFDGTIVEHKYPEIGKTILFAFEALKELQDRKHKLILWTYRSGKELDEAVQFCKDNGIEFYAVNKSFPEEEFDNSKASRKIDAELFIDDRNLEGFPGWTNVLKIIHPEDFGIDTEPKTIMDKFRDFIDELKS
ncbi:MAG: hydrolase [Calditrichaeota bacterium]|nr:MAG: hydrolase [Calditrichota bacterium]MBL1206609.1 hydrolase [Calditrichota bacterium]NOG46436.1 hydrolase [Calditrichota bacterium]